MQMDRAEKIGDRMRDAHCAMKGLLRERYETVVADYKEILGGAMAQKGLSVLPALIEVLESLQAQGGHGINQAMFLAAAVDNEG